MKTLLKWAGGKERELKKILPRLPALIENYYEPFFGGGAVFFNISKINGSHFVNDTSNELIDFYKAIKIQDEEFLKSIKFLNERWHKINKLYLKTNTVLTNSYYSYKDNTYNEDKLKKIILKCSSSFTKSLEKDPKRALVFEKEVFKSLNNKFKRTKKLELEKGSLPLEDIEKIFISAIKSGYYTFVRKLYNNPSEFDVSHSEYIAIFLFIRMYCYSGMFRYNAAGEFNVPYGGIGYNNNYLDKKIDYYTSQKLIDKFKATSFKNLDFESFLNSVQLTKNDFIFLDPPYDTEFSTYAQNEFNRDDQKRLAIYLTKKTKAKWMLVIKSTDFIKSLYSCDSLTIEEVDKKYNVSFMDRNNKDVIHLIIRNYK